LKTKTSPPYRKKKPELEDLALIKTLFVKGTEERVETLFTVVNKAVDDNKWDSHLSAKISNLAMTLFLSKGQLGLLEESSMQSTRHRQGHHHQQHNEQQLLRQPHSQPRFRSSLMTKRVPLGSMNNMMALIALFGGFLNVANTMAEDAYCAFPSALRIPPAVTHYPRAPGAGVGAHDIPVVSGVHDCGATVQAVYAHLIANAPGSPPTMLGVAWDSNAVAWVGAVSNNVATVLLPVDLNAYTAAFTAAGVNTVHLNGLTAAEVLLYDQLVGLNAPNHRCAAQKLGFFVNTDQAAVHPPLLTTAYNPTRLACLAEAWFHGGAGNVAVRVGGIFYCPGDLVPSCPNCQANLPILSP